MGERRQMPGHPVGGRKTQHCPAQRYAARCASCRPDRRIPSRLSRATPRLRQGASRSAAATQRFQHRFRAGPLRPARAGGHRMAITHRAQTSARIPSFAPHPIQTIPRSLPHRPVPCLPPVSEAGRNSGIHQPVARLGEPRRWPMRHRTGSGRGPEHDPPAHDQARPHRRLASSNPPAGPGKGGPRAGDSRTLAEASAPGAAPQTKSARRPIAERACMAPTPRPDLVGIQFTAADEATVPNPSPELDGCRQ